MGRIIIDRFVGNESRVQRESKTNVIAECAINASLQDGALSAIPCPVEVCDPSQEFSQFYYDDDCGCSVFSGNAWHEIYQCRHYLVDGDGARSYSEEDFCDRANPCNLGMPAPTQPPSVSAGVTGGSGFEPRNYMYTFVSRRGSDCVVESPPSPVSRTANCADTAFVSNIQNAPAGWCITHVRLYRFDAGWKSGSESRVENNSGALMVAELPIGTTSHNDTASISGSEMLGLITYDMESMPHNPVGIGATAFSTFSWSGKELYISVDGMPELRRKNGRFCFDHNILNAQYWNNSIYVFTERYNYRIDESGSEGGVSYSNPPFRFEKLLPLCSIKSISVGALGVFYHTKSGISVLDGNSQIVVSTGILNTTQWKTYTSKNIGTFVYQQYLFIFSDDWEYTHLYEFEDGVFGDSESSNHTIYPYKISSMRITDDGCLQFASNNIVYEFIETNNCPTFCFDEVAKPICTECCEYDYRISVKQDARITDYAMGYLRIDPKYSDVTFRLWDRSCGEHIVYEETFSGCGEHQFRLPAGCLSDDHFIQLTGCATVYELRLGTSAKELGLNS